jgi:hypothetical protein
MATKKPARAAVPRFVFQYAVKFLCTANIPGTSHTTTSLLPGTYETVVNIHNPNPADVVFRMKLASAGSDISGFLRGELKPDQATKVDCSQVNKFDLHLIHGFEGFLVIESQRSLDVVAVYTAAGDTGKVTTMDVEYNRERRLG